MSMYGGLTVCSVQTIEDMLVISLQTAQTIRNCKNKRWLSVSVKVKGFVMQHGLLCSWLGGLAHSKLNECE